MLSPVLGLRPERAADFAVLKVPNPVTVTSSPLANDLVMAAKTASTVSCACFLVAILADFITASVSPSLVIFTHYTKHILKNKMTFGGHFNYNARNLYPREKPA